jgi:hypothetical protein
MKNNITTAALALLFLACPLLFCCNQGSHNSPEKAPVEIPTQTPDTIWKNFWVNKAFNGEKIEKQSDGSEIRLTMNLFTEEPRNEGTNQDRSVIKQNQKCFNFCVETDYAHSYGDPDNSEYHIDGAQGSGCVISDNLAKLTFFDEDGKERSFFVSFESDSVIVSDLQLYFFDEPKFILLKTNENHGPCQYDSNEPFSPRL